MTQSIIVASHNPVKVEATRLGFARVWPEEEFSITGVVVPSGVSDQPMSNTETLEGALNRASNARAQASDADFWVGIEGGIEVMRDEMLTFAWVVVLARMAAKTIGKGRTATFILPQEVAELVGQGKELGEADDAVFKRANSKQANGAVGLLTGDAITRTELYAPAIVLALIPFANTNLTF